MVTTDSTGTYIRSGQERFEPLGPVIGSQFGRADLGSGHEFVDEPVQTRLDLQPTIADSKTKYVVPCKKGVSRYDLTSV